MSKIIYYYYIILIKFKQPFQLERVDEDAPYSVRSTQGGGEA